MSVANVIIPKDQYDKLVERMTTKTSSRIEPNTHDSNSHQTEDKKENIEIATQDPKKEDTETEAQSAHKFQGDNIKKEESERTLEEIQNNHTKFLPPGESVVNNNLQEPKRQTIKNKKTTSETDMTSQSGPIIMANTKNAGKKRSGKMTSQSVRVKMSGNKKGGKKKKTSKANMTLSLKANKQRTAPYSVMSKKWMHV